jgi:hypothetical protein
MKAVCITILYRGDMDVIESLVEIGKVLFDLAKPPWREWPKDIPMRHINIDLYLISQCVPKDRSFVLYKGNKIVNGVRKET